MRTEDLFAWIKERHTIACKKTLGEPKPWTEDWILRSYRFCNVYRELDSVTEWIAKNWREPFNDHPDLWFAMTVARLINWPDTLTLMDLERNILNWNPEEFVNIVHIVQNSGGKAYSGAYIVSTNGHAMDKAEYLAAHVLNPLWENREEIRPRAGDTLDSFAKRLSRFNGLGSFMSGQVIADTKYAEGSPLYKSMDWWTWATPGPGSKRGLNRVTRRPVDASWPGPTWRQSLDCLMGQLEPLIAGVQMESIHAQDVQNCLCEFDKYERTRLGEGRPRSTYPGSR